MKCVDFYKEFLSVEESVDLFSSLETLSLTSELKNEADEIVSIPRAIGFFSDKEKEYKYANLKLKGYSWKNYKFLLDLKEKIEVYTGYKFNSVLINLYRDGNDTINWHSDNEKLLGSKPTIASLNIGAERTIKFKRKDDKSVKKDFFLNNGSLLIMRDECQEEWLHSIRRDSSIKEKRYNLTFRYDFEK